MVAQVDEQQMAVVALAVHPARQADGFADIACAKVGAAVGAIGVHAESRALLDAEMRAEKRAPRFSGRETFCQPARARLWASHRLMHIHPLITKSEDLKALVDRLSKQPFVAVDTEFMRENTYWPDLCLIQVASIDEAAAIDPKADIDLKPLLDLFVEE